MEVIIVDDGSIDETKEIVLKVLKKDPRIKFFMRHNIKGGAPVCRNEGFYKSTGEYIIFCDSDDCFASNCLENRVKFMNQNPSLDFSVFPCEIFKNKPGDLRIL